MFLVKCPQCKNTMKCDPLKKDIYSISKARKSCVYCGRNFKLKNHIEKDLR